MDRSHRAILWGDMLCAGLLAALLTLGWTWRDWSDLSALRLPDTDDVMRLQQIRDWLGGQSFADLSQHRLGTGLAMHWSRLPDLVPGALIAALTPLVGTHTAELVAVIIWPAALFTAALVLVARIARALGGAEIARTAVIIAAIAYPTTTIFLPGRIDHHGLQVVLLLVIARTLVARPAMSNGLIAGLAAAASLVIGMETAPLLAAAGLAITIEWITSGTRADDRMMGFGIGTGAGLLAASIVFRTAQWDYAACDGFTATLFRGSVVAAFAPMLMALAARDLTRPGARIALAGIVCAVIGGGILLVAPACLSPYGAVDPLLARLWLSRVGEAQTVLSAPSATVIGYTGVMIAGVIVGLWQLRATRDPRWAALLMLQAAALALTCWQLRGAYAGAILAAPALAAAVAAARARGTMWLAGAWIASAGMLYPIAAEAFVPHGAHHPTPRATGDCRSGAALAVLAQLPPGRMIAPLDLGADAIAATRMSVVGAPYHRNNAGNLATYRFFLGSEAQATTIARLWNIDYVAACSGGFGGLPASDTAAPRLAGLLENNAPPRWLHLRARAPGLFVYTVERRLLEPAPAR